MDGLQTMRELQKIRSDLNIIISSGHLYSEKVDTALKEGAKTFLKKPYKLADLEKSIKEAVS